MASTEEIPSRPRHLRMVECRGRPYELGFAHGSQAADLVAGSLAFYAALFQKHTGKEWPAVKQVAASFHAAIRRRWPRFAEELRGVATGARVSILDIVALNCRTEIMFGLRPAAVMSDGCTTAYYADGAQAWQGQNWDWQPAQKANLICLVLWQSQIDPRQPDIKMVTEAGIIGKIGVNSRGVGVCFNALRAPGCDFEGVPSHLALRLALEATSVRDAREKLDGDGTGGRTAGCAFILVGDAHDALGAEFAPSDSGRGCIKWQTPETLDDDGGAKMLVHTNHFVLEHPDTLGDGMLLPDSPARLERMRQLILEKHSHTLDTQSFAGLFLDEQGCPGSINRKHDSTIMDETLFNIVITYDDGSNGGKPRARVKMGRPSEDGEVFEMSFP